MGCQSYATKAGATFDEGTINGRICVYSAVEKIIKRSLSFSFFLLLLSCASGDPNRVTSATVMFDYVDSVKSGDDRIRVYIHQTRENYWMAINERFFTEPFCCIAKTENLPLELERLREAIEAVSKCSVDERFIDNQIIRVRTQVLCD
jgi:hypothetical protein